MRKIRQSAAAHALLFVACVVGAYYVANAFLPSGFPEAVVPYGIAFGLVYALGSIAAIINYRSGRYINFAQGAIGAAGATLAYQLIGERGLEWYAGVGIGLVTSVLIAAFCELAFMRRFFHASRLIATIATIGVVEIVNFIISTTLIYTKPPTTAGLQSLTTTANPTSPPFPVSFTLDGEIFRSEYTIILVVVPVVLIGFALFFSRSRYGTLFEANAQNSDRAGLVGVPTRLLSTFTWAIVGFLSGLLAIFLGPISGTPSNVSIGYELMLLVLAPAIVAGFRSFTVAVGAAICLGLIEEALVFNYNSQPGLLSLVLFLAIIAGLLLNRNRLGLGGRVREPSLSLGGSVRPFPRELGNDRLLGVVRISGRLVLIAVAVLIPLSQNQLGLEKLTQLLAFVIAALSLTVLTGMAGQVSFAQWTITGISAFAGAYLVGHEGLSFWAALAIVPLGGALLATIIGLPALQIRGIFLAVTTLGLALAADGWLFGLSAITKLQTSLLPAAPKALGVDLSSARSYYYFALVLTLFMLYGVGRLQESGVGRNIVAVRDNAQNAASYGIRVVRTRLLSFGISGFIAALAGFVYLFSFPAPSPAPPATSFVTDTSVLLFAAVIVGGAASRMGAVIAALIAEGVTAYLAGSSHFAWLGFLATGFGLLLVLIVVPQGLAKIMMEARDTLLGWYAQQKGIELSMIAAKSSTGGEGVAGSANEIGEASVVSHASGSIR